MSPDAISAAELTRLQGRRLRAYYRSAGWPCLDPLEIELLAAGLIRRVAAESAGFRIELTDLGIEALARWQARNRGAFDAHAALVDRVASDLTRNGRLVYRELSLRGRLEDRWQLCRPDVFSIRRTSDEAYLKPVIHEIKVRRADLLSDLRNVEKRQVYMALASEVYYVIPAELCTLDEIPAECGVLFAGESGFSLGRAAPSRAIRLGFLEWMALARRGADPFEDENPQASLTDT